MTTGRQQLHIEQQLHIKQQRKLDAAIRRARQEIAMLQVKIARMEDARLLLGALAEEEAAESGHGFADPLLGSGAEIAVRSLPRGEEGPLNKRLPNETPEQRERRLALKRAYNARRKSRDYKAEHARRKAREARGEPALTGPRAKGTGMKYVVADRVRALLADGVPRLSSEIVNALFPDRLPTAKERQSVANALSHMKLYTGELHHSQFGEPYTLVRKSNGGEAQPS